jgi:hypothetical protein
LPNASAVLTLRSTLARLLIASAIVVAALVGALRVAAEIERIDDTVVFEQRFSLAQRQFRPPYSVGLEPDLLVQARAFLPDSARYTVAVGPNVAVKVGWQLGALQLQAVLLLLPRRSVELAAADWLLCFGCARALRSRVTVVWDDGRGAWIGQARR